MIFTEYYSILPKQVLRDLLRDLDDYGPLSPELWERREHDRMLLSKGQIVEEIKIAFIANYLIELRAVLEEMPDLARSIDIGQFTYDRFDQYWTIHHMKKSFDYDEVHRFLVSEELL